MATNENRVRDTFLRTIAVIGLVAVLLLGAWGIIQLAVALPSLFGSLGSGASGAFTSTAQEAVTVSAPMSVQSGQALTLSWTHQNGSGDYSYALSYACQSGLSLKAPLPTGAYQAVPCNTPFNFTNSSSSMTLIPALSSGASATLQLSVSATKLSTGAISATGSVNTNVTSGQTTAVSTGSPASTQTQTSSSAGSTSSYYPAPVATRAALWGYPDLAVTILSVTPNGSLTNVQFQIQNVGTNVVGSGWNFNAMLPINGGYTFASQPQQLLYPGDKIVYTMSYANTQNSQYPYGYNSTYNYNSSYGNSGEYYTGSEYYSGGQYLTGGNYGTCNMSGPCDIPGYNNGYSNYNYSNGYDYGNSGTITITADPYNRVVESSKANNTASIQAPNW